MASPSAIHNHRYPLDCPAAVDVVIKTPSGKLFGAHSANLDLYSEGFPPASFADGSSVSVVELPESEEVVALMLKYMHKQRQPDIRKVGFKVLKGLAEAAEKYFIYSAMDICNVLMEAFSGTYPLDVLSYASKHNYPEICDTCAPMTLGLSLKKVQLALGPASALKWAIYREGFLDIIRLQNSAPVVQHKGGYTTCEVWKDVDIQTVIIKRILTGPDCMLSSSWKREMVALVGDCTYCTKRVTLWIESLQRSAAALPEFSSLQV